MPWNTAHATRLLRNWLEALKTALKECRPNRTPLPATSQTVATSAPIGPAAKVSPMWAKIEADQKLPTPESARTAVAASRKVAHPPNASSAGSAGGRTVAAAAATAPAVSRPT